MAGNSLKTDVCRPGMRRHDKNVGSSATAKVPVRMQNNSFFHFKYEFHLENEILELNYEAYKLVFRDS